MIVDGLVVETLHVYPLEEKDFALYNIYLLVPNDKEFTVPTDVGMVELLESNSLCGCMYICAHVYLVFVYISCLWMDVYKSS